MPPGGAAATHIQSVEPGIHKVARVDQPGCRIGHVRSDYGPDDLYNGSYMGTGAGTYEVKIANSGKDWGVFIEVACVP